MSLIDELSLGTSVNLSGYRSGFDQAARMIDRFVDQTENKLRSLKMPALKAPAMVIPAPRIAAPAAVGGLAASAGAGLARTAGTVAAIGAGAGITGFLSGGIQGAIELNDTLSKTRVIFGDAASSIIGESDRMAAAFGASKNEFVDAATGFGAVFKGIGKSQAEAAGLGTQLTKLGMDLASFEGTANADAFGAISSALRGEFDPLERYRVFLNADAIANEALAMGLARSKKEIDESAKKMATLSLITKQTRDAQGDLVRTQNETSNQWKKLSGSTSNFATSIGQAFLPAVDKGIGMLADFSTSIGSAFTRNRPLIDSFVSGLVRGFEVTGAVVTRLTPSFLAIGSTVAGAFGLAGSSVSGFMPSLETFVGWAESGLATVNTALQSTIGFVREIPDRIDAAFGEGTASALANFAGQAGLIAAAVPVLAGGLALATSAAGTLFGVMTSAPALIGTVGAGIVAMTGSTLDLGKAFSAVGYGVRNFWALGEVAFLKVGAYVDNFMANLGRLADFAANNWLDIMLAPFEVINDTLKELSLSVLDFLRDPTQGFNFDLNKAFRAPIQLALKLPDAAPMADLSARIDEIYAGIAKTEDAFARSAPPAFQVPEVAKPAAPAMASQKESAMASGPPAGGIGKKQKEDGFKFAGAYQIGSTEAYDAILKGFATGPTGFDSGPDVMGSEFARPPEMGGNKSAKQAMEDAHGGDVAGISRDILNSNRQIGETLKKILQAAQQGNQNTASLGGLIKEIQRPVVFNF